MNESITWIGPVPKSQGNLSVFVSGSTKAMLVTLIQDELQSQEFLDIPGELVSYGEPICLIKDQRVKATIIIGCQQGQLMGVEWKDNKADLKLEQVDDYNRIQALTSTLDQEYLAILDDKNVVVKNAKLERVSYLESSDLFLRSICFAWTQDRYHLIGLTSEGNQLCTFKIAPTVAPMVLKDKIQLDEAMEQVVRSSHAIGNVKYFAH